MTPIRTTNLIAAVAEETGTDLTLEQAERLWDRIMDTIREEARSVTLEWLDRINAL